ncbi:D-alanyl-D-alanine carboxypeptidase family protein [Ornithinibacillus contaminans]|uniref:D-alanyl-D-alanine carboxypeptidase family protein n=1 Tax=Ornithinibacillus contaminans TaxID=694055 RepID=UPI00064D9D13|nr:D-alanyl-D-alanine carboxypeptidase family protein [Ornithinibacillus contaminans]
MRVCILMVLSVVLVSLFFPIVGHAATSTPSVSANNAVLLEQSTGRILFEKGAHERQSIASITKIMTAIIAIESGKMSELATASKEAVYTEGSSIYLKQGEKMRLEDLVYGLMLRSGNDAAVTIAEHVGGSEEGFVFLMNEKAKWLGMTNTHFDNPHGLDSETHYSSAYDMALLMRYAMNNEQFVEITGSTSFKSENRDYSWRNKNKLLTVFYKYCTGGKTGFTKQTGRTLVSTASKDGMDLIVVTLDAPDDWRDHMNLFEWGFENYDMHSLSKKGIINVPLHSGEQVKGFTSEDVVYPLTENEKEEVTSKVVPVEPLHKEFEKTIVGKQFYVLDDSPIAEVAIFQADKPEQKSNFFADIIAVFKQIFRMS